MFITDFLETESEGVKFLFCFDAKTNVGNQCINVFSDTKYNPCIHLGTV